MIRRRLREADGVSLLELLISLTVLSIVLLALSAAAVVANVQVKIGGDNIRRWAATQEQMETLIAEGYDQISSGSATVQGYDMRWTVSGEDPKRIEMIIQRRNHVGQAVEDTIHVFISPP